MGERGPNYYHNALILRELHPGDLIEFPRGAYSHWAVYIGNGNVVHLAGEDNDGLDADVKPEHMFTICGIEFNKAKVCKENFWKVVGDSKARKNNEKDKTLQPLEPAEIVENACMKLGEIGYNLVYSNCEHFAKWCRYGISKSDQVENAFTGAAIGLSAALALGTMYAFAKYFSSGEDEEEKQEEEKAKSLKQKRHLY